MGVMSMVTFLIGMTSLYIHIPFCASRCIYCDFYSTTGLKLQHEYVEALLHESQLRQAEGTAWDTIYIGGGTPSSLPLECLDRLVSGITELCDCSKVREWTMECNPDDVTPQLAEWLSTSPIDRVSMGAQTFSDERLRWLRRRHTSQQVSEACRLLRSHGIANISIDLMFGFPGQTLQQWEDDVKQAVSLQPQHISAYSLMYEEGTPLYTMLEQGRVEEIDEELSLAMFNTLVDCLTAAGYEHYEISNFSQPGYRSRHNSCYWHQVHYLGIGAAAHSYDGCQRWWNVADVKEYIHSISMDSLPAEYEDIDEDTRYNDIITTALRTREGICVAELSQSQQQYIMEQAQPHIDKGVLAFEAGHLHLTRKGIFISDDVMSSLIMV